MDSLRIQTAQNVDLSFATAGLGYRLLAWLVDWIINIAWIVGAFYLLSEVTTFGDHWLTLYVIVMTPPILYHVLCEILLEGQTPGKMAFKIRVARLDGAQPTVGQYLLRWLLRFADVTFSTGMVAIISIGASKRAQRLGDIVAGTTVVRIHRRVRLSEIQYSQTAPSYVPSFPEAERLSDRDIRTIRAVIVKLRLEKKSRSTQNLARRAKAAVEKRLELGKTRMPAEAFLRTIVDDYTASHDRYDG